MPTKIPKHDATEHCPGCVERTTKALMAHAYWSGYRNALKSQGVSSSAGLSRARKALDETSAVALLERKACRYTRNKR